MTIQNYNNQLSAQDMIELSYKADTVNTKLKAENQGSKNKLEEADYMQLLITQLKTQDPTNPVDDKEFIGQMTQFTSLQQMNNMAENMKDLAKEFAFSRAISLVNKTVSWTGSNGEAISGVVSSIKVRGGETIVNVNGVDVALDQIEEVK